MARGLRETQIKAALQKKFNGWLKSLPDHLRSTAKNNSLITGGSIASLLLGEKMNDLDVYFKNLETSITFSEHYAKIHNMRTTGEDIEHVLLDITNIHGVVEQRYVIDNDTMPLRRLGKWEGEGEHAPRCFTSNAISLAGDIQLITRFYGSAEEIHKNFDFVHCTNVYDPSTNELHLSMEALKSLMAKRLIYTGSLYPFASVFRTKKFLLRGWDISAGQMMKMLLQINEIHMTAEVMRDQVVGVDATYMRRFLKLCGERNIDACDNTSMGQILDEIFE